MEFSIDKEKLDPVLIALQPFTEKKDHDQITAHILIKAQDNILIFYATDNEMGLKINVTDATIKKEGLSTINGKKFLDITKTLKTEKINIKKEENNLIISQNKSNFNLPTFIAEEFPKEPKYSEEQLINLSIKNLTQDFKKIIPIIDNTHQRVEITGALINGEKEQIEIVGTDTKRLGIITHENTQLETNFIIPKKAIAEIQKIDFDETKTKIYQNTTNLIITDTHFFYYTKLINGHYPEYKQIIPQNPNHKFTFPRDAFLNSIRLIGSISNEVQIEIKNKEIIFSSYETNIHEKAQTSMELETNISNHITIAFNIKSLLDFLSSIQTQDFEFYIQDSNSPAIFKSENFSTITMPIGS